MASAERSPLLLRRAAGARSPSARARLCLDDRANAAYTVRAWGVRVMAGGPSWRCKGKPRLRVARPPSICGCIRSKGYACSPGAGSGRPRSARPACRARTGTRPRSLTTSATPQKQVRLKSRRAYVLARPTGCARSRAADIQPATDRSRSASGGLLRRQQTGATGAACEIDQHIAVADASWTSIRRASTWTMSNRCRRTPRGSIDRRGPPDPIERLAAGGHRRPRHSRRARPGTPRRR